MIDLRPLQEEAILSVRRAYTEGHRSVLLYGPCGFGKTVCFSWLSCKYVEADQRVVIIAHRDELVQQISRTLNSFGVPHTFAAAGYAYDSRFRVVVASAMSLVNRLDRLPVPDLVIVDEAHHCIAGNSWGKILSHWGSVRTLGVSATPCRADGRGLGEVFQKLVLGPTTAQLIEQGWLSKYRIFAPPGIDTEGLHKRGGDYVISEVEQRAAKPTITGDAITHYKKLADGKRAVVFCVSVAHAEAVAAGFRDAGIGAMCVDGSMHRELRRMAIRDFETGRTPILTSCSLVSEGFDVPAIECAISLRPTASTGLWLQQVGRALRIAPGKNEAIILDHAGNTHKHGMPDDDRQWSLEGLAKGAGAGASNKRCPICFAVAPRTAKVCKECGHEFIHESRESTVKQVDGELSEVTREQRRRRLEQVQATDLKSLLELAKMRGYRNPEAWVSAVMRGRRESKKRRQVRALDGDKHGDVVQGELVPREGEV